MGPLPLNLSTLNKQVLGCNVILNEQKGSWFHIQVFNLFLVSKDQQPKNGSMGKNVFVEKDAIIYNMD